MYCSVFDAINVEAHSYVPTRMYGTDDCIYCTLLRFVCKRVLFFTFVLSPSDVYWLVSIEDVAIQTSTNERLYVLSVVVEIYYPT